VAKIIPKTGEPLFTQEVYLRRGRSCVFLLHVHLVFVAKYRRCVFTKPILTDVRGIFQNVCEQFGATLIEFEGEREDVHLLVN
jgi:putative transposase